MECILSGGGVLCDLKMTGILVVSLRLRNCRFWSHVAVADADLQISGVGGGHPDLRYGGGGCLRPFGPQFHLKIREAPSPGSTTA